MDNQVPSLDKLATALSKAQGDFPAIPKNKEVEVYTKDNPRRLLYKYKYADLTIIIEKTRPSLIKQELSFTQTFVKDERGTGIETKIIHSSGQVHSAGFVPMAAAPGADMKQVAGAMTYAKRISLTAALGISADEDVDSADSDANEGRQTTVTYPEEKPVKPKPKNYAPSSKPLVPETRLDFLTRLVAEKKIDKKKVIQACEIYGGKPTLAKDLTPEQLEQVIKHLTIL